VFSTRSGVCRAWLFKLTVTTRVLGGGIPDARWRPCVRDHVTHSNTTDNQLQPLKGEKGKSRAIAQHRATTPTPATTRSATPTPHPHQQATTTTPHKQHQHHQLHTDTPTPQQQHRITTTRPGWHFGWTGWLGLGLGWGWAGLGLGLEWVGGVLGLAWAGLG